MLSAPFHPIQTSYPNNSRVRDFGGGKRGIEIDGNGASAPIGFSQRICLPQGATRSIRSTVEVISTLIASPNGYEGIGCDVKALIRNGFSSTPLVTYTNAPFLSGDPDQLTTDQFPEWSEITRVVRVPYNIPSEFLDVTWAVRGTGGLARFNSASLRNYYQDEYETQAGGGVWTEDFPQDTMTLSNGANYTIQKQVINTFAAKIAQNSEIEVNLNTYITSAFIVNNNGVAMDADIGLALKLRRKDGGFDWWNYEIKGRGDSTDINDIATDEVLQFRAKNAYTQVECCWYFRKLTPSEPSQFVYLGHQGVNMDVIVKTPIRSGAQ